MPKPFDGLVRRARRATGETNGHVHLYDDTKSGETSLVEGHAHPYEAGAERTAPGGGDGHTHGLEVPGPAEADPRHLAFRAEFKGVEPPRAGEDMLAFSGIASTFGDADLVGDVVERGAFAEAAREPARVLMLWCHRMDQPIGVWDRIRESDAGLEVSGRLLLDVERGREAAVLLKHGAIDGLSIGFSVPPGGARVDRAAGVRRISRLGLHEISIVAFPANPRARVSRARDIKSIRDFESVLRDEHGFPHRAAKRIASGGWSALEDRDDRETVEMALAGLSAATARLHDIAKGMRHVTNP